MKQNLKHIVVIALALVMITISGGATLYSHFCKMENSLETSFSKIEHKCAEEKVQKSCHQEEPEDACHDEDSEEKDCCNSFAEYETVDQVNSSVESFVVELPVLAILYNLIPMEATGTEEYAFIDESPPLYAPPLVVQFQRFLC